jgi:hypothetical protein
MSKLWYIPIVSKSLEISINLIIVMLIIRWGAGQKRDLEVGDYVNVFIVSFIFYILFYYAIQSLYQNLNTNASTKLPMSI